MSKEGSTLTQRKKQGVKDEKEAARDNNDDQQHENKEMNERIETEDDKEKENQTTERGSFLQRVITYMFEEEDSSYLALFRILWGCTMAYEIYTLMARDFLKLISLYYLNPHGWNFKYYLFEWVVLMEFEYMKIYVISLLFSAIFVILGLKYRFSSFYFFIGISYIFLVESTNYLNHIYLVTMIAFVMIFIPCNCCYSLDSWKNKSIARDTVPKIYLIFLKGFLIVVYMYAGIVKINEDWLRAEPLRHWVGRKANTLFGTLLTRESSVYFLSYGGLVYDLIVGFLLLFNPTFWLGIIASIIFHTSNKIMFHIGIFPQLMIASTSLFFSPFLFRKFLFKLRHPRTRFQPFQSKPFSMIKARKLSRSEKLIFLAATLFMLYWIFFPLRNYAYPGSVEWNEHGHVYSWRMKLRDKSCHGVVFGFQPEDRVAFYVPVRKTLSSTQSSKVFNRPWLFTQFAHYLADLYSVDGVRAEIYTYWYCSVNFRERQLYADPTVDFGSVPKWDWYPWMSDLIPLDEKYNDQYPWNWEWNFNWLKGNDTILLAKIQEDYQEHKDFSKNIVDQSAPLFAQFISEKYFGGDISKIDFREGLVPPTSPIFNYFASLYNLEGN